MFSKKKSFLQSKIFYGVLCIGLLAFGYWMSQGLYSQPDVEQDIQAEAKQPVREKQTEDKAIVDSIVGDYNEPTTTWGAYHVETDSAIAEPNEENVEEESLANKAYYLVKEEDGLVNIFYYDEEGNEQLIRATAIEFSLIGEEDQKLFTRGIVRYTKEELNELLQDFES